VLELIRDLTGARMTMMIVTHEVGLASALGNRLIFMDQGKIVEEGIPGDLIDNTQSPRMQAFLGTVPHRHQQT
jgi:ABC-type polar amino acid transport system ATPase subunit